MSKKLDSLKSATEQFKNNKIPSDILGNFEITNPNKTTEGTKRMKNARLINIDKIVPDPNQPRKIFENGALLELAESIREHGILQPITVEYKDDNAHYMIVTGERRYQASKIIDLKEIPCIILNDIDLKNRFAKQLIENIQREDFTPIEKARALLEYKEMLGEDSVWEDVEKNIGISKSRRLQFIRLLNLPVEIQQEIVSIGRRPSNNKITEKHARALLSLNKFPEKQQKLFEEIKYSNPPISGDEAINKVKIIKGKKEYITFKVTCENELELLNILRKKIKELEKKII